MKGFLPFIVILFGLIYTILYVLWLAVKCFFQKYNYPTFCLILPFFHFYKYDFFIQLIVKEET